MKLILGNLMEIFLKEKYAYQSESSSRWFQLSINSTNCCSSNYSCSHDEFYKILLRLLILSQQNLFSLNYRNFCYAVWLWIFINFCKYRIVLFFDSSKFDSSTFSDFVMFFFAFRTYSFILTFLFCLQHSHVVD